jgi:hypothetical protein
MKKNFVFGPSAWFAILMFSLAPGCGGSSDSGAETSVTCDSTTSTCVVVGIYTQASDGSYTDENKDLTFTVGATCESWSRLAPADSHDTESHLHYNAHRDSTYTGGVFEWFEYGPEINQADIDATCAAAQGGAKKTATSTTYTPDKKFFVQIKTVTP